MKTNRKEFQLKTVGSKDENGSILKDQKKRTERWNKQISTGEILNKVEFETFYHETDF